MHFRPSRSLDDALAVVFVAFALLVGASLWHELAPLSVSLAPTWS